MVVYHTFKGWKKDLFHFFSFKRDKGTLLTLDFFNATVKQFSYKKNTVFSGF